MKTKLEIIEETANFYTLKNRGWNESAKSCEYLTKEGNMCAVGRCLMNALDIPSAYIDSGIKELSELHDDGVDGLLKEEYRGHNDDFWMDLQNLHDNASMWTDTGLSEKGKEKVELLKELYKDE